MYKPDERADREPFTRESNRWALKCQVDNRRYQITKATHTFSSTAPIDCRRRTISPLDPYTPRGFIISLSNVLKSTLVIDAYAPGETALIKRWRVSWAMMTLSTMIC
jgi:hypothetical protein